MRRAYTAWQPYNIKNYAEYSNPILYTYRLNSEHTSTEH